MKDSKKVLEVLLSGGELRGFDGGAVERARILARAPNQASAAELSQLPEPLAEAVLEASVRAKHPALAESLLDSGSKPLAKAAKRALYQLRSSGVAVSEPAKPEAAAPTAPAPAQQEEWSSLTSAVTGTGERAVLAVRPVRGGLEMFQAVISDDVGILQLATQQIGRSAYRKQLADIRKGAAGAIEITFDEARALLARAAGLNVTSRTSFPQGVETALRLLNVTPNTTEPEALPEPLPDDVRVSREGHFLHNEPEVLSWLPPESEIRLVAQKGDEVIHSPLQLTDAQKNEQILNAFYGAAHAFFTPAVAKIYARRLWAMADYFQRTGRERPAELARAEARRLFHGHNEPPSRFAEFLFEKILLLSQRAQAAQGEGLPPPGTGLPVAEEARPAEPAERRSPGGLILP